jgi:hypothetical protein
MELAKYTPYTIQKVHQLPVGTVIKFINLPGNFDSLLRGKYITLSTDGWFVVSKPLYLSVGLTLYFADQYPFLTGHWFKQCHEIEQCQETKQDHETAKTNLQGVNNDKPMESSYIPLWQRDYWQF